MSCESKESGRNSMSCESKESATGAIGIKSFIGCRCSEFNVFDMCDSFAGLVIHDSLVGTDMNHAIRSFAVHLSCPAGTSESDRLRSFHACELSHVCMPGSQDILVQHSFVLLT